MLKRLHIQQKGKKADYLPIEPDEIKSYTVPISNINDVKVNPNISVLKNEFGEMQKESTLCYSFLQCPNLKAQKSIT